MRCTPHQRPPPAPGCWVGPITMVESSRLRIRNPCLRPSSSASGALGSCSAPSPLVVSSCEGRRRAGIPPPSPRCLEHRTRASPWPSPPELHGRARCWDRRPPGHPHTGQVGSSTAPPHRPGLANLGRTYLLLTHRGDDCPHVIAARKLKGGHHLGPDALLEGHEGYQQAHPGPARRRHPCPPHTCSTDRAPFFP